MPFYPRCGANQGAYPNFSFFHCVHLGFTFEFIKELGNVSHCVMPLFVEVVINLGFKGLNQEIMFTSNKHH
jgi:hypothetical protein